MVRDLPGTVALQAFESAAFHLSITQAGRELHLTQSAITRQIQALEEHLGVDLFVRVRQRIRLTPAGERYLQRVRRAFDELESARLELRSFRLGGGVLQLVILPTFGTQWLSPRFPGFARAHPEVQVNFTTRIHPFEFEGTEFDAAIHHGEAQWAGAEIEHLLDETVVVVCAPPLRQRMSGPAQLGDQVLLQMSARPGGWRDWLQARDVRGVDGQRGPRFENHAMVLQAAIAGLGVALLPEFLIREELLSGRLVEAFPGSRLATGKAYWLVFPPSRKDLPALDAFRRWLQAEVARERQGPVGP